MISLHGISILLRNYVYSARLYLARYASLPNVNDLNLTGETSVLNDFSMKRFTRDVPMSPIQTNSFQRMNQIKVHALQ